MKKIVSLLLSVAFIGSMMLIAGCAPKQEAQQAPAMEQPAAVGNTVAAEGAPVAPAAEQTPAPAPAQ